MTDTRHVKHCMIIIIIIISNKSNKLHCKNICKMSHYTFLMFWGPVLLESKEHRISASNFIG